MSEEEAVNEYSDDDMVYESPSNLWDIQSIKYVSNNYPNGTPIDYKYLKNPSIRECEALLHYSINYCYQKKDITIKFHIFRTPTNKSKENENNDKTYFPPNNYLETFKKIQGKSLIKLVDYCNENKWIHFEYIPGTTLYDSIKYNRTFNIGDNFKIIFGIAITIQNLHAINISNLDLRPENIIITTGNMPVLADVDMIKQSFDNLEKYDDEHLPYLDPFYFTTEDPNKSKQADIYSFGLLVNLFIRKKINFLTKEELVKIRESLKNFPKEKNNLERCLNDHLKIILNFEDDVTDKIEKDLLSLSSDCLMRKITSSEDLVYRLKCIRDNSHLSNNFTDLEKELKFEDCSEIEKYDFYRSDLSLVEQSASIFNARDMWLTNKMNEINNVQLPERAADACLYAAITGDYQLYEEILTSRYIIHNDID